MRTVPANLFYDPENPGHGLSLFFNPDGKPYAGAWYAFDGNGSRTWLTLGDPDSVPNGGTRLVVYFSNDRRGFPLQPHESGGQGEPVGHVVLTPAGTDAFSVYWSIASAAVHRGLQFSPPPSPVIEGTFRAAALLG